MLTLSGAPAPRPATQQELPRQRWFARTYRQLGPSTDDLNAEDTTGNATAISERMDGRIADRCRLTHKLSGEHWRSIAKNADRTHAGVCPLERRVRHHVPAAPIHIEFHPSGQPRRQRSAGLSARGHACVIGPRLSRRLRQCCTRRGNARAG